MSTQPNTPTNAPTPPDGFQVVTKEAFFTALAADRRDIMPTTEARTFTPWRVVSSREMWGWSSRGYVSPYRVPEVYAIKLP